MCGRSKASTSLLHETGKKTILMKQLEELSLNYILEGTDKREVFPVHGMKAYRGRRGRVPLILSLDSRRRRMVNYMLDPFHLGERTPLSQTNFIFLGLMTLTIFHNKYKFWCQSLCRPLLHLLFLFFFFLKVFIALEVCNRLYMSWFLRKLFRLPV